jgi:hypothetical protein
MFPWLGETSQKSLTYGARGSIWDIPGWQSPGTSYSAVQDPAFPWDEDVVAAIREFWPNMIPIRKLQRWASPREAGRPFEITLVYHVLASHVEHPHYQHTPFYVEMPAGADFPAPNQLDMELYSTTNTWGNPCLFGDPVRLDWQAYPHVRKRYDDRTTIRDLVKKHIEDVVERELARQEKMTDQFDLDMREPNLYFQKKLAGISDVEAGEYRRYIDSEIKKAKERKLYQQRRAQETRPVRFSYSSVERKTQ